MPLVAMRQILDKAARDHYAVAAFAVNNMEEVQAVVQAAVATDSPLILQVSRGSLQYGQRLYIPHIVLAAIEETPHLPVALHLDHGNSLAVCQDALSMGFSSVMIDATLNEDGRTLSTWDYAVSVTKSVVEIAHSRGATVEAEFSLLVSLLGRITSGGCDFEDDGPPRRGDRVAAFVQATGVDVLQLQPARVLQGTHTSGLAYFDVLGIQGHGAYKFTPSVRANPLIETIQEIATRLPDAHLALGEFACTDIVLNLIDEINRGGRAIRSWGAVLTAEDTHGLVRAGVRKLTVRRPIHLAMTAGVRRHLREHPEEYDPRQFLGEGRAEIQAVCTQIMRLLGQAGHGHDY